jgi:signal transduction histidine kinase
VLERLHPQEQRFAPVEWPPELGALRAELRERDSSPEAPVGRQLAASGVPLLLIPLAFPRSPGAGDPLAAASLVVELDRRTLAAEVLPRLARAALRWGAGEDVTVSVIDPSRPGHVVYRSDAAAPAHPRDAELSLPILGVRAFEDLLPFREASAARHAHHPEWARTHRGVNAAGEAPGGWRLLVRLRGRSIEEEVRDLRWHNLAASLGILGLLATTAVVLVATTQRARRLARQQIEFVAGVTHELHTPLAAIRAAGENLADGVVAEPAQVRRYGALIEGEGRRLSTQVAQLLELAGIQSGRRAYRFEPVEVGAIVDGALTESRWLLEQAGVAVERDVPDHLPQVLADTGAVRRAVQNLIENGVKYGGQEGRLRVRARATDGGVEISIADRGPGIRRDELRHLFEPFFRGRDAAAAGVPGVGLGLALVRHIAEAHGGRVSVASEADHQPGAVFTLQLPAAPTGPAREELA